MAAHLVYILLGSNMGNRRLLLQTATNHIQQQVGQIIAQSSIYRTAAWGNTNQPHFYNQLAAVNTSLTPQKVLELLLSIELEMGRVRIEKMGPRTIDLDILYFDDGIINTTQLTVPHPQIQNRKFVLKPLVEIAPNYLHPSLLKTNQQLLKVCNDPLKVTKLKRI
jgi:2-amino-4-hydroxy-6-hydroxymethyldihydropteridine diphosphokinase